MSVVGSDRGKAGSPPKVLAQISPFCACRTRLWDAQAGQDLSSMRGHTAGVFGVAFSANAGLLASGSDDGTVKLWDTSSFSLMRTLRPDRRYERADITGLTGVT